MGLRNFFRVIEMSKSWIVECFTNINVLQWSSYKEKKKPCFKNCDLSRLEYYEAFKKNETILYTLIWGNL